MSQLHSPRIDLQTVFLLTTLHCHPPSRRNVQCVRQDRGPAIPTTSRNWKQLTWATLECFGSLPGRSRDTGICGWPGFTRRSSSPTSTPLGFDDDGRCVEAEVFAQLVHEKALG